MIAIIGIIASIAAPPYRDDVRSAQVAEIVRPADGVKTGQTEFHILHGRWPSQAGGVSDLGRQAAADYETDVVQCMWVTNNVAGFGRVIVDVKAEPFGAAGRVRLALSQTGSLITGTYRANPWPTDAQFRPDLPDDACGA